MAQKINEDHVFYRTQTKYYPTADRGEGVYIYDKDGKQYIDGSGGAAVVNIGHGVKGVEQAMLKQASRILFAGLLLFIEIGRRIGAARVRSGGEGLPAGMSVVDGAVFGLLGLIIAFTFSGAASRFEARRHLITEEANAIGTAYLRVNLLPAEVQPEIRELFRKYVDLRVAVFRGQRDIEGSKAKFAEGIVVQEQIWTKAVEGCRRADAPPQATLLLLAALNEMIDITIPG